MNKENGKKRGLKNKPLYDWDGRFQDLIPMSKVTRDRVKGSLWGLLVGDALGSPLQFGPMMDEGDYLTEMEKCGVFHTPKGCWTDDGSLALCIIESFNRLHKYDINDIGNNFWKWQEDGFLSSMPYSFDEGFTTQRAITQFHYEGKTVATPSSPTNGGIMRFCPGAFVGIATDRLETALEIARLTHSHEDCDVASEVLMEAILQAVSEERDLIPLGHNVRSSEDGEDLVFDGRRNVNPSGAAIPVLSAALWAFHKTSTFEDALVEVVNLGNDSDTSGAICGQIAGAFYGFDAIPKRWLNDMKDYERIEGMIEEFLDTMESVHSAMSKESKVA